VRKILGIKKGCYSLDGQVLIKFVVVDWEGLKLARISMVLVIVL
jgi:hypothetical protein